MSEHCARPISPVSIVLLRRVAAGRDNKVLAFANGGCRVELIVGSHASLADDQPLGESRLPVGLDFVVDHPPGS